MRRNHPLNQHIGVADGRIAIWCDETLAFDIAAHFPYPDRFSQEIHEAIERAYPPESDDDETLGISIAVGLRPRGTCTDCRAQEPGKPCWCGDSLGCTC